MQEPPFNHNLFFLGCFFRRLQTFLTPDTLNARIVYAPPVHAGDRRYGGIRSAHMQTHRRSPPVARAQSISCSWPHTAVYCGAGREFCRPSVRTPSALFAPAARNRVCGWGLKISLCGLRKNGLFKAQLGHNPLRRIFFFASSFRGLAWSAPMPPYSLRQRYYVCSVTAIFLQALAMLSPSPTRIFTSRSFKIICSGLNRFLGISFLQSWPIINI